MGLGSGFRGLKISEFWLAYARTKLRGRVRGETHGHDRRQAKAASEREAERGAEPGLTRKDTGEDKGFWVGVRGGVGVGGRVHWRTLSYLQEVEETREDDDEDQAHCWGWG